MIVYFFDESIQDICKFEKLQNYALINDPYLQFIQDIKGYKKPLIHFDSAAWTQMAIYVHKWNTSNITVIITHIAFTLNQWDKINLRKGRQEKRQ